MHSSLLHLLRKFYSTIILDDLFFTSTVELCISHKSKWSLQFCRQQKFIISIKVSREREASSTFDVVVLSPPVEHDTQQNVPLVVEKFQEQEEGLAKSDFQLNLETSEYITTCQFFSLSVQKILQCTTQQYFSMPVNNADLICNKRDRWTNKESLLSL